MYWWVGWLLMDGERCWWNADSLLMQSTLCRHSLSVCFISQNRWLKWFVLVVMWTRVLKHDVPGTNMWNMVNIRLELPSSLPHVHTPLLWHSPFSHWLLPALLLTVVYLSNSGLKKNPLLLNMLNFPSPFWFSPQPLLLYPTLRNLFWHYCQQIDRY